MAERALQGWRVLVVEDEYLIADEIAAALATAGAAVVGPAGSVEAALALIVDGRPIDAAVLDMNLRGESGLPVAERLQDLAVPFVFASGYDRRPVPSRYTDVEWCEKPIKASQLVSAITRARHRQAG